VRKPPEFEAIIEQARYHRALCMEYAALSPIMPVGDAMIRRTRLLSQFELATLSTFKHY
jgi:hypothetical protein